MRLPHFVVGRAEAAVVVHLAADRVGRERFLQHRCQARGWRERRIASAGRRAGERSRELLHADRERFHALAICIGIEVGSAEDGWPASDDAVERGREALVERRGAIAIDAARRQLRLPPRTQRSDLCHEIGWWLLECGVRRAECGVRSADCGVRSGHCGFGTVDDRLGTVDRRFPTAGCLLLIIGYKAFQLLTNGLACGDPLRTGDVVPLRISREEVVACAAEALPQRFGTAFLHRADRLPFGLEAFDFADGGVPVCRLAERFDFRAERVLLCQVVRPPRFAVGEVGVTTREEAIAGGAEALPDRFLLPTGDRADPLPFRLQLLDLVGGLDPARRPGERFGALAQGDFLREVFGARFSLRREMRFAALPRLVVRRLEPAPQRLALRARHVGGLAPLLLQFSHLLRDLLGIVEGLDRFHLFAELLLDADVRPALPVGDVAQLLDLRYERGLRGLQPADGFLVVTLGRERRNPAKRRAEILERAFAGLERQIGTCGNRLDAAAQLLQPDQGLAARPLILLAGRGVAGRERRVGLGVARKDAGSAGRPVGHAMPLAADNVELAACHRQILECRGPRRLVGELREPLAPALRLLPRRVAPLAR